ncbi:MAG: HypC/HybG/HupF family hydrogenase formation chaperone [Desulfobacteraceae bacterium]|nr:HypC/HybG/HupF family hydrogenase formation chaperone [Desulfobacteraceae bacterium]
MCLAIPMEIVELKGDDGSGPTAALVDSGGIRREVRLDIVDRLPNVGDYVIVHAGFAIHALTRADAEASLSLLRRMARQGA